MIIKPKHSYVDFKNHMFYLSVAIDDPRSARGSVMINPNTDQPMVVREFDLLDMETFPMEYFSHPQVQLHYHAMRNVGEIQEIPKVTYVNGIEYKMTGAREHRQAIRDLLDWLDENHSRPDDIPFCIDWAFRSRSRAMHMNSWPNLGPVPFTVFTSAAGYFEPLAFRYFHGTIDSVLSKHYFDRDVEYPKDSKCYLPHYFRGSVPYNPVK